MTRKSRTRGGTLLILGLIIVLFGLLLTLQQATLVSYLKAFLSIEFIEVMGVLLQLVGVFIIVAGLTSLVRDIIAIQLENEMRSSYEILSRVDRKISDMNDMMASQRLSAAPQTPQTARVCKFCGAPIADKALFCPNCGRSQD